MILVNLTPGILYFLKYNVEGTLLFSTPLVVFDMLSFIFFFFLFSFLLPHFWRWTERQKPLVSVTCPFYCLSIFVSISCLSVCLSHSCASLSVLRYSFFWFSLAIYIAFQSLSIACLFFFPFSFLYRDNIFVKRSIPTVHFSHKGINPFDKIDKIIMCNIKKLGSHWSL